MSLSSHGKLTGKVILGMDTPGPDSMTVQEMEGKRKLSWDETMNQEFMSRVRGRAQDMARDIIAQAMAEAEQIKIQAEQDGFNQGLAQGEEAVRQHIDQSGVHLGQILESVAAQGNDVWSARRHEMAELVRLVIRKVLNTEMDERRSEIVENLMDEALERIEAGRILTLRVAPGDEELVRELLEQRQERNSKLTQWQVKADPTIEMGTVIETNEAMVDNTVAGRWSEVEPVLAQFDLQSRDTDEPA